MIATVNKIIAYFIRKFENIKYARYGYSQFKIVVSGESGKLFVYSVDWSWSHISTTYFDLIKLENLPYQHVVLWGHYDPTASYDCLGYARDGRILVENFIE